ncbi:urease accessory protein UreF [Pseudohoeflea sp. DP4N28-3]|uniref:Urease accessory protein UreF n=2 Tax=Pseudohoeflea coraliihabitans TaxID=2860393 RepID=A0ABS6WJW1_9HYPH|nr:urease accessory protein UreF [Pseudohoeflea sp. DP4N28-3]
MREADATGPAPAAALLTLLSWLSPAFPTGGFAYSAGLETAVLEARLIHPAALEERLQTLLEHGAAWNDAVLLAAANRAADDEGELAEISALAVALCGSFERLRETQDQGEAFRLAASPWTESAMPALPHGTPFPVVLGVAAAHCRLGLDQTLAAFLHAFVSAQLQAAIRLSLTGQTGAASILARLEAVIGTHAARAATATLDDIGTATLAAEIDALRHETLPGRLFLS